jgi:hypothetical protein
MKLCIPVRVFMMRTASPPETTIVAGSNAESPTAREAVVVQTLTGPVTEEQVDAALDRLVLSSNMIDLAA